MSYNVPGVPTRPAIATHCVGAALLGSTGADAGPGGGRLRMKQSVLLAAASLALLACAGPAAALEMLDRVPRVSQLVDGSAVAFALRFDRLVDHGASSFVLKDATSTRRLKPRLNAQPNTLFASVGQLRPGNYELEWQAKVQDGEVLAGSFSFTVGGRSSP
jgi:methionine-rich copper-binding protein CopC